jgi:hypothetical protein
MTNVLIKMSLQNTPEHKTIATDISSLLVFCGKWQKTNCDERSAQTEYVSNISRGFKLNL